MVHIAEAHGPRQRRRLLAPDAAGAEHGDGPLAPLRLAHRGGKRREPSGKLGETARAGIAGARETADAHLVTVAGVDDERRGVRDEGVPVGGVDILADLIAALGPPHGYDLGLHLDLEPPERDRVRIGKFDLRPPIRPKHAKGLDEPVDARLRPRHGAIESLPGEDKRSPDALCLAQSKQPRRLLGGIGERHEAIGGTDADHRYPLAGSRGA